MFDNFEEEDKLDKELQEKSMSEAISNLDNMNAEMEEAAAAGAPFPEIAQEEVAIEAPATLATQPVEAAPVPKLNRYQELLSQLGKLKPAQENYQKELSNIGIMQGVNKIAQGVASGYGGKIDDGSALTDAMKERAAEPMNAIKRELETAKNEMGVSTAAMEFEEATKMADPDSDISKMYREQAYALLKKRSPESPLINKLEGMSASQLQKMGFKDLLGSTNGVNKAQKTDLLTKVITDELGSFRRNLQYDPIEKQHFYMTPRGPVNYYDQTTRQIAYMNPKNGLRDYFEEGYAPPGWVPVPEQFQYGGMFMGMPQGFPQGGSTQNSQQALPQASTQGSQQPKREPIKIDYNMLSNVDVKMRDTLMKERSEVQNLATTSLNDAKQLSNLREITEKGVGGNEDLIGYVMNNVARTLNGEKGTMTEGDIQRAAPRQDWLGVLEEWKDKKLFNKLSPKSKKIILEAIKINKDVAVSNLESLVNIRSRPAVRDLESIFKNQVDPKSVEEFMGISDALDEYRKFNKIEKKESPTDEIWVQGPSGSKAKMTREKAKKYLSKPGYKEVQ